MLWASQHSYIATKALEVEMGRGLKQHETTNQLGFTRKNIGKKENPTYMLVSLSI